MRENFCEKKLQKKGKESPPPQRGSSFNTGRSVVKRNVFFWSQRNVNMQISDCAEKLPFQRKVYFVKNGKSFTTSDAKEKDSQNNQRCMFIPEREKKKHLWLRTQLSSGLDLWFSFFLLVFHFVTKQLFEMKQIKDFFSRNDEAPRYVQHAMENGCSRTSYLLNMAHEVEKLRFTSLAQKILSQF